MPGKEDFGWGNLLIKFALFVLNMILLLFGCILLAVGIFALVEVGALSELGVDQLLASPAIIVIIFGAILFILGFTGCFGAVIENFPCLVIYCIVMTGLLVIIIGCGAYVYLQQENAEELIDEAIRNLITQYYDDPDLQNFIDLVQQNLKCCGSKEPNDWEANIYFNCSSIAFQRCSVPFSCCEQGDDDEVINLQCGYRTLDISSPRFQTGIYLEGCLTEVKNLIEEYIYYFIGILGGLVLFMVMAILLTSGLAIDVRKEQKTLKVLKEQDKRNQTFSRELGRI